MKPQLRSVMEMGLQGLCGKPFSILYSYIYSN